MRRANGAFGRISPAPFHLKGASINNVPDSLPESGKYSALTARLQFVVCTGVYTIAEPGRNDNVARGCWPVRRTAMLKAHRLATTVFRLRRPVRVDKSVNQRETAIFLLSKRSIILASGTSIT